MRYLFIQPEFENIGLEYLSAVLKRHGHSVELLFIPKPFCNTAFKIRKENEQRENQTIEARIREYHPDVVGFSPFTSYFQWAVSKADLIKGLFPDIFILFGGVHATLMPELTITEKSVDAVMIGEGEVAITQFTDNYHHKKSLITSQNIWIKENDEIHKNRVTGLVDLEDLPYPDKDLFLDCFPEFYRKGSFTFMASRGCPRKCSYCSNSVYNTIYRGQKTVRYQSPEYVIEQLSYFKTKYDFKKIDFMDDVFATNLPRLEALLPLLKKEINVPFVCFMYPDVLMASSRVIKLLKDCGCSWLKIGVQSANERYRRKILKRKEGNGLLIKIADICNQHKLPFSFDHILQLPGENKEDLIEAVKLYNRCRPRIINFGNLIYLPKTPIIEYGLEVGNLKPEDVDKISKGKERQALSSNIERFKGDADSTNYSTIVLLFTLLTLLPKKAVDFLIKKNLFDLKLKIPEGILVLLKVVSKFRAGQGYVYLSALKYSAYYGVYMKLQRVYQAAFFRHRMQ